MSSMPSITVVLSLLIIQAFSFTATTIYHGQRSGIVKTPLYNSFRHSKSWKQHLLQSRADDDQDETETKSPGIPQLPAIGASSFHHGLPPNLQEELQNLSNAAFVSPKFELQYTCKVCNTRNCHLVSRIAYREGVVITTCKGCGSNHMIADNLGKGCLDGDANIEDYFKARGMDESVNRVNQEVFELEKILDFQGYLDDDGNAVLE